MIYFAQDQGTYHIKIGFTDKPDPDARIKNLDTGNPFGLVLLATIPGTREDEDRLHKRFHSAHLRGEWFCPVPELLRFIIESQQPQASGWSIGADQPRLPGKLKIYLAGKISGKASWRSEIVGEAGRSLPFDPSQLAQWPVLQNAIFGEHHWTGPFFVPFNRDEDDHGVGASVSVKSGSPWCCSGEGCNHCGGHGHSYEPAAPLVVDLCFRALERSDVVFAWIDSLDCYGTVVELGYAASLGKPIWLAGPRRFRDMWFLYTLAADECGTAFDSAGEALKCFLDLRRV